MIRIAFRPITILVVSIFLSAATHARAEQDGNALDALIARHAAAQGVPQSLLRRVIKKESTFNPRLIHAGNYGLMQIRLETAREMGYRGDATGLLDADTNMTYAVKYLAGALRFANGNHERAIRYYTIGYDAHSRRKGYGAYATSDGEE